MPYYVKMRPTSRSWLSKALDALIFLALLAFFGAVGVGGMLLVFALRW